MKNILAAFIILSFLPVASMAASSKNKSVCQKWADDQFDQLKERYKAALPAAIRESVLDFYARNGMQINDQNVKIEISSGGLFTSSRTVDIEVKINEGQKTRKLVATMKLGGYGVERVLNSHFYLEMQTFIDDPRVYETPKRNAFGDETGEVHCSILGTFFQKPMSGWNKLGVDLWLYDSENERALFRVFISEANNQVRAETTLKK
jgi:hypothetical protein